ncbi:MAG: hypothetical protein FWE95_04645 [Planctomycetaceae bacterium]|nr:hypothetical protein [Planctomycetaceae bacterium]
MAHLPQTNLDPIVRKAYPSFTVNRQTSVFRIIGVVLRTPLSILWQLLNQFLLSPWGLIVPMTLLIALFALQQLQQTPAHVAQFYADQLDTCTEAELPQLLEALVRMGDAGVPGLVQGLTSHRESVFTASRNAIEREFDRWQESVQREHHYRVFSEALFQSCKQFSPAAQAEAMRFVDQMMRLETADGRRQTATETAESTAKSTADRQAVIAHCGQILAQLESMRRRRLEPQDGDFAPQSETIAALNRRAQQPVLLASNGQPFVPTSARQDRGDETHLVDTGSFNPFSVARADRLAAYQRSLQTSPAQTSPAQTSPAQTSPAQTSPAQTSPAQTSPAGETADGRQQTVADASGAVVSLLPSSPPLSFPVGVESKVAQNFAPNNTADISEEYRKRIQSESESFGSDTFLTPELLNTPLDRVPHLPTTQLMQLLHHPTPAYTDSAQQTLMSREGFQESHLRLAWRLYHPIPTVRQEIVAMLPHTANVQPAVWLSVLLDDPNNDVRYRTASFLATTGDPTLQRLLIDRGKRDGDERITSLAHRLDEVQRGTVRR